jgi:hypothetical protein
MNRVVMVLVVALIAAAAALQANLGFSAQPRALHFDEVQGRLQQCAIRPDGVDLRVALAAGRTIDLSLLDTDANWPRGYDAVVTHLFAVRSPCPAVGTALRVARCAGCDGQQVDAIELGSRDGSFDVATAHLWVFRQYIDDIDREHDQARVHLFIVSRALAHQFLRDGSSLAFWLRGPLARSMATYASVDRGRAMISRYGTPDLLAGIAALRDIYVQHADDVGVVKSVPYRVTDFRTAPFIGSWGTFALDVRLEVSGGLRYVWPGESQ